MLFLRAGHDPSTKYHVRRAFFVFCSILTSLWLWSCTSDAGDGIVRIAAAQIEYDVPGDWDVSGEKPMDPSHVCYPQLRRHNQDEIITFTVPPKGEKASLQTMADRYVALIEGPPLKEKCEAIGFTSYHQVNGFNLRYGGGAPQTSDPTIVKVSVYMFLNRREEPVFVQYIAAEALFRKDVDDAIRKSLNYMADTKP